MEQSKKRIETTYMVQCSGTPILGSVCSFAHEHAIFKMLDILKELEKIQKETNTFTYDILTLGRGNSDKLPVEYCEAKIKVQQHHVDANDCMLEKIWNTIIETTKYDGITIEILK